MDILRIGILGYNGVTAINVVNVLEVFAFASAPNEVGSAQKCYEPITIGFEGTHFVSESGIAFTASCAVEDAPPIDTLIIPGGTGLRDPAKGRQVAEWVKCRAGTTRRIASICTGIYGVAPSGLLDNRRVTTHWEYAGDVAERFPKLHVEESELYIKDDRFYSSAGATAGIDLALALITEDLGREVSLPIAQRFLVYLERDGGQEQYSPPARVRTHAIATSNNLRSHRMGKLLRWITHHLSADLSLEKLAAKALLSKRELVVQFREAFGAPPGLFVKNLRLNEARSRLLRGDMPYDIARSLRFHDPVYFIQEFRRRFGALPGDYQRRFASSDIHKAKDTGKADDQGQDGLEANSRPEGYRRPRMISFTRCLRGHRDQSGEPAHKT